MLIVFLKYNNSKDKKLKEITQYIEEINRKNYKLNIDDNTEDELSILKNEVYKTTIMLKEQAENSLNDKGVIIARCWQDTEHYVLITKIDDNFAYLFDPYYLKEDYYVGDKDVAIVLHETFTHNRIVKIERLFDESLKDFSLLEKSNRSIILMWK